ncbi:hypothetical protein PN499_14680 [Kamptonema animale CS-326]|jgi:hypothetical protein|uniref:hypothetical protein n=1 Tax=Kamptonema animale TaxID=92934 RepID=UPI00232DF890|nr:hypothetical protein [Kamptonema animale]MDB9512434.1 hypothetical protein [Kamptonema animale CS-326]
MDNKGALNTIASWQANNLLVNITGGKGIPPELLPIIFAQILTTKSQNLTAILV